MARYWFAQPTPHYRAKLAFFAFLLAFIVILLGGFTRLTNAGLSCPDWPNCYGYLTAPHTPAQIQTATAYYPLTPVNTQKAWTEMTHRYFAGTEGILILILTFSILLTKKFRGKKPVLPSLLLIILLCIQVSLGMLTVTEKLKPIIVLSHLLTGISILSVLWWIFLSLRFPVDPFIKKANAHLTPWFLIGLIVVFIQITLGGWVSTHSAGLACIDLPYCNGQLIPQLSLNMNSDLITIHMLHRFGAFFTAVYIGILALSLLRNTYFKPFSVLMLTLLCLQLALGILNILWLRPIWIALIHQGVAILLLLTMITVLTKVISDNRHGFYLV